MNTIPYMMARRRLQGSGIVPEIVDVPFASVGIDPRVPALMSGSSIDVLSASIEIEPKLPAINEEVFPSDLSSTTFWLSHTRGVTTTGNVGIWRDVVGSTGVSNIRHVYPATSKPPAKTADGPLFDAANSELLRLPEDMDVLDKFVFVRFRRGSTGVKDPLVSARTYSPGSKNVQWSVQSNDRLRITSASGYYGATHHSGSTLIGADAWHVADMNVRSDGLDVKLDGNSEISTTASPYPSTWDVGNFGADADPAYFDGEFSDVVIASSSLSSADATAIREYLAGTGGTAPDQIAEVQHWWHADSQTEEVTNIADQIGSNDASPPSSITRPGVDDLGIFFGDNQYLELVSAIDILGGTLYMRHKRFYGHGYLTSNAGDAKRILMSDDRLELKSAYTSTNATGNVVTDDYQVSRWDLDSDSFDVLLDGISVMSETGLNTITDFNIGVLGHWSTAPDTKYKGWISDVILLDDTATSDDHDAVMAYLNGL